MKDQDVTQKTVLIIEDNEINCQMLEGILEEKYSILTAGNGQEGLSLLKKYGQYISAIMLDIQMPIMDGYEFLELMESDAVLCKIPVIVTTILDSLQDEVRCLELGAVDFIAKPYNPKLIMIRLDNIIRLRECDSLISELEIDALTGFKNRKAYYHDIEEIEGDEMCSRKPVGIAFADINGLKSINDRLGHEAGDKLIASIARAIAEVFPDANKYRLGGDEFVVLSFEESEDIFKDKILQLERSWQEGYSAAVGSVWLDSARKLEQNVALADKEMYREKSRYYENKMHDRRHTLRVDTEDTLKQMEVVAEHLPGGFFIYKADESEELIFCNAELVKLFGCETEEEFRKLTGNSFKGMVHPEDLKLVENDISDQIQKENDIDCVKYRIVCKDGTEKFVLDYGRFVHTEIYGDVYYVFMNDIT